MKQKQKSIIIIAGATASGKSDFALKLAKGNNGLIVNADSEQVYYDLQILTARPSDEDMQKISHALYGFLPGDKICSAGLWQELALKEILNAFDNNQIPIIVGGTGMYIKSLTNGIAQIPPLPKEIFEETENILKNKGLDFLYTELIKTDENAKILKPLDKQRIVRAYNVLEFTGKSIFDWQKQTLSPLEGHNVYKIFINPPREKIYQNCEKRLGKMIKLGCIDEVQNLMRKNYNENCPINKAIGVAQFKEFLNGKITLEQAKENACRATRNYVKKQLTWFRNQFSADLIVDNQEKADSFMLQNIEISFNKQ